MSNIVTFSKGSVDLDAIDVVAMGGVSSERMRELLASSSLGQSALFAVPPIPPKKAPPPPSGGSDPAAASKSAPPHVAIHVHAPASGSSGGSSPDSSAPPSGGGKPPPQQPATPPTGKGLDPATEQTISDFLSNLPQGVTMDQLAQFIQQQSGGKPNPPPAKGKSGSFSMNAREMFASGLKAEFGAPGSGPFKGGNNPTKSFGASHSASKASVQAVESGSAADHAVASNMHKEAADNHTEIADRADKAGDSAKSRLHRAQAAHHQTLSLHHQAEANTVK